MRGHFKKSTGARIGSGVAFGVFGGEGGEGGRESEEGGRRGDCGGGGGWFGHVVGRGEEEMILISEFDLEFSFGFVGASS